MTTDVRPARLLVMGTDTYRDRWLVDTTLEQAARWLNADHWTGRPGLRRDLILVIAPAPTPTSAEESAYRWADKRGVPTEAPPDGWEVLDNPTLTHAQNLITAADIDLALVYNRRGPDWLTTYVQAAHTIGIPVWAYVDHRGDTRT